MPRKKRERADNDSPWKEILEAYFPQAIQFFFPNTAKTIDWTRPHEFLDKEFQKIVRVAETGRLYADKLVKVWDIKGKETWLLIHVEIQAVVDDDFAERMYAYNHRIYQRFGKHPVSLAILCDNNPKWRPSQYKFKHPDTSFVFKFGIVKLLTYLVRWQELESSDNIFAIVVMAHLKMQETEKLPQERKIWKLWLVRRLYEKGLIQQDIRNLYRFIDWIIILPQTLEEEFDKDLEKIQQEETMPYITSYDRYQYKQGQREIVFSLLQEQFGELPENVISDIKALSRPQLMLLGKAILHFTSIDDLVNWLQANPPLPDDLTDRFV
ncbi:hypothetical protein NIES4071_04770 [Calothrix sp. NIES-4071]|nr:hypothetical protein NIES4071_04770 [Calothrix sp. NIES-4071]BAZ54823.1 hypothetical protein NIES4105_04760 [Calothrix sp. NIES-4105]